MRKPLYFHGNSKANQGHHLELRLFCLYKAVNMKRQKKDLKYYL